MRRVGIGPLLLLPLAAWAGAKGDDIYTLDLAQLAQLQVSTPTRTPEALAHTAGTVLVFTREDIRARGWRNLAELLQALPGVYVQGNSSADAFNTVSWRGIAGNNKFLILQNGVRIGNPAGEPLAISDNFPLYYARRVEIVYGPGSALYGTDALAGVINIITDTANGGDSAAVQGEHGDVGYNRASVQGHFASGDRLRLSAGAQKQGAANTDLASAYPQQLPLGDLDNAQGQVVIPAAARNPYDGATASWQAYADALLGRHWQFGYEGRHFVQPSTTGDQSSFNNYGDSLITDTNTVYGRYRFAPTEKFSGELTANYAHYELTPGSAFDNRFTGFTSLYKYAESERRQAELTGNYQWTPAQLLTGGLFGEQIQSIPKTADLTRPYTPGLSTQQQGLYYAGTNDTLPVQVFNVRYHDWSGFVQAQSTWSARLRSVASLRYDHYSNFGGTFNPRLTLTWEPVATQKFSLLAGRAFLAPAPYYTYELFGSFNGTQNAQGQYQASTLHVPNPDLGPERVQTLEADYQWRPDAHWQYDAALYRNRLSGFIVSAATNPPESGFVPGGFIANTITNINNGQVIVNGLDLSLEHTQELGSLHLHHSFSLSFADGEQSTTSGPYALPYTPRQGAKLASTAGWGHGWSLSPALYAASPAAAGSGGLKAPGYAVLNIFARKDNLLPRLDAYARLDDLFDNRWYNPGSGTSTTLVSSPQSRRTYTVGVEVRL